MKDGKYLEMKYKTKDQKGKYGEEMVLKYHSHAKKVSIEENKLGSDVTMGKFKVQIKYDETIAKTGNLYFEMMEKSKPTDKWRHSPNNGNFSLFIHPLNLKNKYNECVVIYKVLKKILMT